jgi:hypothetical protein
MATLDGATANTDPSPLTAPMPFLLTSSRMGSTHAVSPAVRKYATVIEYAYTHMLATRGLEIDALAIAFDARVELAI